MQVSLHASAARFLVAAERFLRSDPFSANVIAVIADRIAAGTQPEHGDNLWVTVHDRDGGVRGVAMQTPPYPLFVSRMSVEAATALAWTLADDGRDLPGVNGAVGATTAFAEAWGPRRGETSRRVTAMRMYRLGELVRPTGVSGAPALAAAPGAGGKDSGGEVVTHIVEPPTAVAYSHSAASCPSGVDGLWSDRGLSPRPRPVRCRTPSAPPGGPRRPI